MRSSSRNPPTKPRSGYAKDSPKRSRRYPFRHTAATASFAIIERTLADPLDLVADRQAHRDAAAIVRTLGHTYSLNVMRQWLRDGRPIPASPVPTSPVH